MERPKKFDSNTGCTVCVSVPEHYKPNCDTQSEDGRRIKQLIKENAVLGVIVAQNVPDCMYVIKGLNWDIFYDLSREKEILETLERHKDTPSLVVFAVKKEPNAP